MFIKCITISGFKSFGSKVVFDFQPGVSAIVGPNGSGKSNVADAVRWVFGEQSAKTLRVKKSEDVIFAGTGKRARGSVAEVRLIFDNSDGALPVEFSEVELGRKLYGSGESEYRVNGHKARLQDVQQLLAAAGVGVGSYAIIGQGTIDSLVTASPADRKLLFEEASGIRQFELKREQALKRLRSTEDNMQRARDILAELNPRLKSLERSLSVSKRRDEIKQRLEQLKAELGGATFNEIKNEVKELDSTYKHALQTMAEVKARCQTVDSRIKGQEGDRQKHLLDQQRALKKLNQLEAEREHLFSDIGLKQAELGHLQAQADQLTELKEKLARAKKQLQEHEDKKKEFKSGLKILSINQKAIVEEREQNAKSVRSLQQKLVHQRKLLSETAVHEYVGHAQAVMDELARTVAEEAMDVEAVKVLTYKTRRLLNLAVQSGQADVVEELKQFQSELTTAIRGREKIEERYTDVTLQLRHLELEITGREDGEAKAKDEAAGLQREARQASALERHIANRTVELRDLKKSADRAQKTITSCRDEVTRETPAPDNDLVAKREQYRVELRQLEEKAKELKAQLSEKQSKLAKTKPPPGGSSQLSPSEIEKQIITEQSRLEALSEVAEDVSAEHAEASERQVFISTQLDDLERARTDLHSILEQLDGAIKQQFADGFQQISDHFSEAFADLFGGGTGRLSLHKEEGEIGIEIEVKPPGKRVKHLAALSGGERSLAGIALLAAIIRTHPSPILILDEVDAALDEANSDRFRQLLAGLSRRSQIITITHNRATMVAASRLYGVTMDSSHISRMVSAELEEAARLSEAAV